LPLERGVWHGTRFQHMASHCQTMMTSSVLVGVANPRSGGGGGNSHTFASILQILVCGHAGHEVAERGFAPSAGGPSRTVAA